MVTKILVADSENNSTSTGNIYFCLSKAEPIFYDLRRKNKLTAFFSNETNYNGPLSDVSTNYVYIIGYIAQVTYQINLNITECHTKNTHTHTSL